MEIRYTEFTNVYMHQYLLKYVGKYRVLCDYNLDNPTCINSKEFKEQCNDLYIPCSKGVIKHTFIGDDILACCFYGSIGKFRNVVKEFKQNNIECESEEVGIDGLIYFNAKDINRIAKIVKPRTSGKGISPFSLKNVPKEYRKAKKKEFEVPDAELEKLKELTKNLTHVEKMQFSRRCGNEFLKILANKHDKCKDYKEFKKINCLNNNQYIYHAGYWKDYIDYIEKEVNKL